MDRQNKYDITIEKMSGEELARISNAYLDLQDLKRKRYFLPKSKVERTLSPNSGLKGFGNEKCEISTPLKPVDNDSDEGTAPPPVLPTVAKANPPKETGTIPKKLVVPSPSKSEKPAIGDDPLQIEAMRRANLGD